MSRLFGGLQESIPRPCCMIFCFLCQSVTTISTILIPWLIILSFKAPYPPSRLSIPLLLTVLSLLIQSFSTAFHDHHLPLNSTKLLLLLFFVIDVFIFIFCLLSLVSSGCLILCFVTFIFFFVSVFSHSACYSSLSHSSAPLFSPSFSESPICSASSSSTCLIIPSSSLSSSLLTPRTRLSLYFIIFIFLPPSTVVLLFLLLFCVHPPASSLFAAMATISSDSHES